MPGKTQPVLPEIGEITAVPSATAPVVVEAPAEETTAPQFFMTDE